MQYGVETFKPADFPPLGETFQKVCEDCKLCPNSGLRFYNEDRPEDIYCSACYKDQRNNCTGLKLRPFESFKDLSKIIEKF